MRAINRVDCRKGPSAPLAILIHAHSTFGFQMKLDARALPLLETFGLRADNPGVCLGPTRWRGAGPTIASMNPANEQLLARVASASAADVDGALAAAGCKGKIEAID